MTETEEAPLKLRLHVLDFRDGSRLETLAHAMQITESMLTFWVERDGDLEVVAGFNIDELRAFTVTDPQDPESMDPAPTLMDSDWGYRPEVRGDNPFSKKKVEKVADPFRGGQLRGGGDA